MCWALNTLDILSPLYSIMIFPLAMVLQEAELCLQNSYVELISLQTGGMPLYLEAEFLWDK